MSAGHELTLASFIISLFFCPFIFFFVYYYMHLPLKKKDSRVISVCARVQYEKEGVIRWWAVLLLFLFELGMNALKKADKEERR